MIRPRVMWVATVAGAAGAAALLVVAGQAAAGGSMGDPGAPPQPARAVSTTVDSETVGSMAPPELAAGQSTRSRSISSDEPPTPRGR